MTLIYAVSCDRAWDGGKLPCRAVFHHRPGAVMGLRGVITPASLGVMTQSRSIRVRIPITVTVDIDAWSDAYGCESTAAEVRKDVRDYFDSLVAQSPAVVDANLIVRVGA